MGLRMLREPETCSAHATLPPQCTIHISGPPSYLTLSYLIFTSKYRMLCNPFLITLSKYSRDPTKHKSPGRLNIIGGACENLDMLNRANPQSCSSTSQSLSPILCIVFYTPNVVPT